jgi:hypothetical protein
MVGCHFLIWATKNSFTEFTTQRTMAAKNFKDPGTAHQP